MRPGRLWRPLLRLALALATTVTLPPLARATEAPTREAYSQPRRALDEAQREQFLRGRSLMRRAWVVGPTADQDGVGLGPLYNRLSCIACHPFNGRGRAPEQADERLQTMLVRLSVPGAGPHGGPRPHPRYGDQFNEEGVRGVPGEGRVSVSWVDVRHRLADGSHHALQRPQLHWEALGYGPLQGVLTSARVGPGVYGLGALQGVPDAVLLAAQAEQPRLGLRGRVNRVWDPVAGAMALGRFGWKANAASLSAQVVQAAAGDLGLTSSALPGAGCTARQRECLRAAAASQPQPELGDADVAALTHYLRELAAPPARGDGEVRIEAGRTLFSRTGCAACHRPALTGADGESVPAYTDLLLHDLGAALADGRPDYRASARQWRTAPLWGLGLVPRVNEHSRYLHDGRARDLHEAVLWHDGEARRARLRYERLTPDERAALLDFVASR